MTDLTLDAYKELPLAEIEEKLREERIKILGPEKDATARSVARGKSSFLAKLIRPTAVNDTDYLKGHSEEGSGVTGHPTSIRGLPERWMKKP